MCVFLQNVLQERTVKTADRGANVETVPNVIQSAESVYVRLAGEDLRVMKVRIAGTRSVIICYIITSFIEFV